MILSKLLLYPSSEPLKPSRGFGGRRCERTFITFENDIDEKVFKSIFPAPKKPPKFTPVCPITKLPAKYLDPVTQLPYRNMQAFKIIREAYHQYLEVKMENSENPEAIEWMEWRRKVTIESSERVSFIDLQKKIFLFFADERKSS